LRPAEFTLESQINLQFEWASVMETEQERQVNVAESNQDEFFGERLVLASASPRRAAILRAVGWPFDKSPADIDETRHPNEEPVAYVERLALQKAQATAQRLSSTASSSERCLILGADTVVVVERELLGKPIDEADARRMLKLLSGRWHEVITGLALLRAGLREQDSQVAHERTLVRFASLTAREIDWYVASGEPMDKAGAYAIQGRAARFVEEIQGDYLNIVGLPVRLLYKMMTKKGDHPAASLLQN
jgi:septum formation protein